METQPKNYSGKEIWFAVLMGLIGMATMIYFSGRLRIVTEEGLKNQPAPEIEFESPNGKELSLSRQRGSVILLNFWASWCQPCMDEMPSLKALENHYKKEGFLLLAFNIEGNPENIRGKIIQDDMPENLIFSFKKEFLRPYRVNMIPLSILIDRDGIVRNVYAGPRNWVSVESRKEIQNLLDN